MLLVDELVSTDAESCITRLTIRDDNVLTEEGHLTEYGIIEHMAQSASALAGYQARMAGATTPPVGMIGEVKGFQLLRLPLKGEEICTEIRMGLTVGQVTNVSAKTYIGEEVLATSNFKIVMEESAS